MKQRMLFTLGTKRAHLFFFILENTIRFEPYATNNANLGCNLKEEHLCKAIHRKAEKHLQKDTHRKEDGGKIERNITEKDKNNEVKEEIEINDN